MIFPLVRLDRQVVDAGVAYAHQALVVELPVLVAVAAEPVAAVVVPFVSETHGDAVVAKRPDFLDETVVEFALPFARQERHDCFAPLEDIGAIAPATVLGIGE